MYIYVCMYIYIYILNMYIYIYYVCVICAYIYVSLVIKNIFNINPPKLFSFKNWIIVFLTFQDIVPLFS